MELLKRIKDGEDYALSIFLEKYRRYSWSLARLTLDEFPKYGYLVEDLMSIAFGMVFTCLKTFKHQQNSFYVYWKTSSRNAFVRYIKRNTPMINDMTVVEISLDKETDEGASLHDYIGKEDDEFETSKLYNSILYIVNKKENRFTKDEISIITLYLGGKDHKQISTLLDCSLAKVYKTFRKAVLKIRKVMSEPK